MRAPGLFDGMGGWAEGLRLIDPALAAQHVGFELDPWATRTARAAGHRTIRADVETWPLDHLGPVEGFTASPPCQAFSPAGKGEGRDLRPTLSEAAAEGRLRPDLPVKVRLVLEPLRWIDALRPGWVAMEQVPAVLPVWQAAAHWLRSLGYSAWAGVLNAADYGVPQTRKRALLLASLDQAVGCPEPTHARDPQPSIFDELRPWVTMADALGWEPVGVISTGANSSTVGPAQRTGDWRSESQGYKRPVNRPAPTLDSKAGSAWAWQRPATTLVGSFCPDVVAAPGYRGPGDGPRQNAEGSVKITEAEALTLQSFRPDYPLQGPKGARFLQIGNAVPPLMVAHALAVVTGREAPTLELAA